MSAAVDLAAHLEIIQALRPEELERRRDLAYEHCMDLPQPERRPFINQVLQTGELPRPPSALKPIRIGGLIRFPPPPPERLEGLLYASALHSLSGPPEVGKTTLVASWTVNLLNVGRRVVIIDEESGAEQTADRLRSLGADADAADRLLDYVPFPGLRWTEQDVRDLVQLLGTDTALVVVDSATAALSVAGLDEMSNRDVPELYRRVLLHAARTSGAAVVILDHVVKSDEKNRYARGAGVKLGLVDVALRVDPLSAFTRQQSGAFAVEVVKDRLGWLHRRHEAKVDVGDGRLTVTVAPVDDEHTSSGPKLPPATAKLLEAVQACNRGALTQSEIVDAVVTKHGHGLRRETVTRGLTHLVTLGLLDTLDDKPKRWSMPLRQV